MRILIIGHRGSGKTTAGEIVASPAKTVSTSDVLIDLYKQSKGHDGGYFLDKEKAREELWRFGRGLQSKDPLCLVREALRQALMNHSPTRDLNDMISIWEDPQRTAVVNGVRNPDEMKLIRELRLFNLIIWIEREGCTAGSTDLLTPADADVVIQNNGSTEELRWKLAEAIAGHAKPTSGPTEVPISFHELVFQQAGASA